MLKKTVLLLYKIFFIGLMLQFIIQTFVSFKLWLNADWMKYIWLWKELIIGFLLLLSLIGIIWEKKRKQLFTNTTIGWRTLWLIGSILITLLVHFRILHLNIGTYALAFKYDFLGFIILLAGFHSSSFLENEDKNTLLVRYGKLIKYALIGALIWYFIIFIKPGTLKLFGYDNFAFEWKVGMPPPAAYYNLINHGITRNQFLFERPISRGFFLVAFFPFFFMLFLHKKSFKNTRFRRIVFWLNIFLTFSRAARGARLVELAFLLFFLSKKSIQKILLKFLIPWILLLGLLWFMGYQKFFQRGYSDTGHVEMLRQSIKIISRNPLRGQGGSSAWPGSHRKWAETHLKRRWLDPADGFNPENQYLQIIIEFGFVGFLGWFLLYLTLNLIGIHELHSAKRAIYNITSHETALSSELLIFACSLWIIWLSFEWLVLHSFVDRMIVYPFMLLFGIIRMCHRKKKQEEIANQW